MITKYIIGMLLFAIGFTSCKRDALNTPVEKNGSKPGVVTNVIVSNINGAAKLTYSLPVSEDLLYVKAVYEIRPGVKREVVSSYYNNSLVIDGFPRAGSYDVKLYAVSRSEIASDPVSVQVNPLESPVILAFRDLAVQAGFGGPNIKTKNEFKAPIVIVPLMDSSGNGSYHSLDKIYTQADSINYTIRGLEDKPTKFAFYITDRFGNTSDTMFREITPLAEVLLDKSKFSEFTLPGDGPLAYVNEGVAVRLIWNGNYNHDGTWPKLYTNVSNTNIQTITWSMGVTRSLSRMKIFPRSEGNNRFYEQGNLRDFEVWGSVSPNPDGSYDNSWFKLATKTIIRPSGLPYGQPTSTEDLAYALGGWDVEFEPGAPAVRYLRIRCLRNWQGLTNMWISQIDIWGSKQ